MSTANKLAYLNTTKQNLKTVINTTGAGLTDESTFRSYANVLNDKILGAINGDVDLFEEYPKVSSNGIDLSLNGVVEGKMSITPQGVSKQKSTTGKNIFNVENGTITYNGLTLSVTNNVFKIKHTTGIGNISAQAITPYKTYDFDVSKPYVWSLTKKSGNWTVGSAYPRILIYIKYSDNTTSYSQINLNTSNQVSGSNTITFTSGKTPVSYAFGVYTPSNSVGDNSEAEYNVQLEQNSTATSYEPYTGGIPAPNPSYPYPVKRVTGENSLVISNSDNSETQNYQLSLGNIELNSSPDGTIRDGIYGSPEVSYNLLDYTQWTSGSILDDGSESTNVFNAKSTNYIPVLPNTTYSFVTANNITNLRLNEYTNIKTHIQRIVASGTNKLTITTTANTYYLRWSLNYNNATTITEELLKGLDLMLIKGSEVKPYFPYGQVGMWYKREYIYKFIITGNEDWQKYSTNRYYLVNPLIPVPIKYRGGTYCTHFKWNINQQSSILNNCIYSAGSTANLEIYPSQEFLSEYDTNQKFKTWLQSEYSNNNPVIAYYQRAESVDIPITDTTLINQLNDIYNNAHSYNGVTNITTTYEDGNEQMYLDIEALKNVWEVTE